MKKLILTMAIAFAGISMANAGSGDKTISSLISKHIKVPASLKKAELEESVNVEFTISESGKATVLNVNTDNNELKSYIKDQFPKINFNNAKKKAEALYFIDINFKVM